MSRGAEGGPAGRPELAGAVEEGQRRRSEFNRGEKDGSGSGQLWAVAAGRHQSIHLLACGLDPARAPSCLAGR